MNSTGTTSTLSSLFMSLGGGLDLKDLDLSTDGASGLADFSSVLQNLVSSGDDGGLMSLQPSQSMALASGETLPLSLPLSMAAQAGININELSADSLSPDSFSPDELIEQIQSPLVLGVNHAPNSSLADTLAQRLNQASDTDVPDDGVDDTDLALTDIDTAQELASLMQGQTGQPLPSDTSMGSTAVSISSALTANSGSAMNTPRMSVKNSSEPSSLALGDLAVDADLEGAMEEFRPVTLEADSNLSDGTARGQSNTPMSMLNISGADPQVVSTKTPDVSLAALNADTAKVTANIESDAYEGVDLQADESFEQKLQTQLRERLEFGQDRKEWGGALGARLMTMVSNDIQQARIQLDPPELGSLEIKLHIHQDQASVQVSAQNGQVKEVLDGSAQRLRDALNAQGIELAEFSVSADAGQQQSQQGGSTNDQGVAVTEDGDWQDAENLDSQSQAIASPTSLLDTFA